jgi:hypothetical protein
VIGRLVEMAVEMRRAPSFEEVLSSLLPMVRNALYFTLRELEYPDGIAIPHVPIGSASAVGVAIDSPMSMRTVTREDLARWDLDIDQLVQIARSNLVDRGDGFDSFDHQVWGATVGDGYDSSRLILVERIRELPVRGRPVALVPDRETLLIAGDADAQSLAHMADLADELGSDDRPIHKLALRLGDSGWTEYVPGPETDEAVRARYRELARLSWHALYSDQCQPLQRRLGDDVYVAESTLLRDQVTGARLSFATWPRGAPALLPRVDWVALEGLGFTRWDRLIEICGAQVHGDGRRPPRWVTGPEFPGPRELALLELVDSPRF